MVTGKPATQMPLPAQTMPPRAPRETLPTMYELPSEDPEEPGLPDEFHYYQPQLLRETFQPPQYAPDRFFVASDLNLYYTVRHPLWHKRPDWFAVLGVSRLYDARDLRLSYVIWQEEVAPYVVIELLAPGTEREDLGETQRNPDEPPTKWTVYAQTLRIPYYIVFSRSTDELHYFEIVGGRYREVHPPDQRLWLPEAELGLGLWAGTYHGFERQWLRYYDAQGEWIPTPQEREHQRAEQERQRAQQEHQRAERLEAQLRELGITPEQ